MAERKRRPRKPPAFSQKKIDCGEIGHCGVCGALVGIRVPRFGDGSYRVCFSHHDATGRHCEGSGEPAKGWD